MYLPSAFPISGNYIAVDGTSITTASIAFALGLSVPDNQTIRVGDTGAGASSGLFGYGYLEVFDDVGDRHFEFSAANVTSGQGLDFNTFAGSTIAAAQRGGIYSIYAGSPGAGGNYGYVRVGNSGTPNRFTLTSSATKDSLFIKQALEVDGNAFFDGLIEASSGSASAPSIVFSSATTTGFWLNSATDVRFSTNGTARYFFSSGTLGPVTDVASSLGSGSNRWNIINGRTIQAIGSAGAGNPARVALIPASNGVNLWIESYDTTSLNKVKAYNVNTADNVFEMDTTGALLLGTASKNTTIGGHLVVTGTTTLATSLTGLLKATSGVVSTATAGTDYVHTLSVTSPILNVGTAADPNIALDETASYSWSGQHTWLSPGDITLKEDVKFYIGDNNSGLGRLSLQYNSGTSQVELADEDSYISNGGKFSIQPNILVDPNLNGYSQFGATPQLVTPSNSNDTLVVGRSYDGVVTGGKRAGFFESYYTGSTSHAGFNAGLNSFASTTSGSSGNLTASTQSGGLSGGRYRTAHAGLGLVSLSTGISILTSWTGSGNTTEAIGLQIETPTKTLLGGPVNWYGIKLPNMSGGAIASTATYGIYVQPIKSNYPVWFASNAEAFFRESGNKIYSSGAAALDVVATTTLNATAGTTVNLQAGGTTPVSIASSTITLKDAVNFVGNTGTGNKIGTATNQKWSVFNATPVAQQTATTDLGTALSNFGIRAAGTAYPITTSGNILFNGGTFEISKAVPLIQLTDTTGSSDDYSIDVGAAAASRFRIRNTTDATTAFDVDGTNRIAMSTNYAPQTAYKVYVQDRDTAASPAANYAALSSSFEYLPSATTTTMGSNLHGYQGGVTAYASNGNISGGGAFFGLRGDATVFLGNATTQSNSAVGLFASYAQSQLSGTGGTAAQGSGMATFLSVGANSTLTAGYHIRVGSTSNSGTITTLYGIYIPAITSGSTNYELFLDTNARAYFRDGNQYLYSSAASTLDDSANTTRNLRIGGTIELALTATQLDLMSATTDRVNFIGGAGATAPSTSIGAAIVNYYGSSATNFLGDPVAWLDVKVNGTNRKIPLY